MRKSEKPSQKFPSAVQELSQLLVGYVRQETVEPIKGLGRFLAWGLAGSLVLGVGIVLLLLGTLRLLQTETDGTFDDNWSWAPYMLTLVGCAVVAVGAMKARSRNHKGEKP